MRDLAAHEFVESRGHATERRFRDVQYAPGFSVHLSLRHVRLVWIGGRGRCQGGCRGRGHPCPRHGLPVRGSAPEAPKPGRQPREARSRGRDAPGFGDGVAAVKPLSRLRNVRCSQRVPTPKNPNPASNKHHAGRARPLPSSFPPIDCPDAGCSRQASCAHPPCDRQPRCGSGAEWSGPRIFSSSYSTRHGIRQCADAAILLAEHGSTRPDAPHGTG